MKKLKIYFIFLVLFISLFNLNVNAENYNIYNPFPKTEDTENTTIDILAEIYNHVNAGGVRENMPEAAREYLGPDNFAQGEDLSIADISGKLNFGFIFNIIMRLLGSLISTIVKNFIPVLAFIILSAVIAVLKNLYGNGGKDNFSDILNFVLILCLASAVFYNVRDCFYTAKNFLEDINAYMMTMIPVMASLSTLSGNISAAMANSAGLYVVLNVIEAIGNSIILPVLQICFALSFVRQLTASSDTVNLSGISSYMRSVLNWIFIFIMTVLTAVLLFQNILASSADTVAARTVKFTFTSFVPVVGGTIGEVSRTIMGSIGVVKSITGIFGVLVIIITLLPPLITVVLNKLMLKISGAFALILGMDKQSDFLKEMNSLLDITVAVMVSAAIVFIFDITVFIKTMAA
ncbi:MAG: stage III sporulation protein AE [Oscillospiraceae bacterium]|nr:stage III sporulation protein AE [Oscillospiraceae bacterium]